MKNKFFLIHRLYSRLHPHLFPKKYASLGARMVYFFIYLIGLAAGFVFFFILLISPTLPSVDSVQSLVAAQSTVILDRNGEVLYAIHGEENRKNVLLSAISPYAVNATLAIEDDRFYSHFGIDVPGILKAVCGELRLCKQRGGSTITQQFVKNAFLSPERTYIRKIKEMALALKLERRFSKDEILEMYLNRINYGSNIYGMELAAQTFFGKPAKELDVPESAILAAIPNAPTYYSPYGSHKYPIINLDEADILRMNIQSEEDLIDVNPQFITKGLVGKTYVFGEERDDNNEIVKQGRAIYVKGRVDFVLERMRGLGMISGLEMRVALKEAESKEFNSFRDSIVAPHFVMYVRELLEEKYGKETLEKGGFKVTTTLDARLQQAAEEAIDHHALNNESRYGALNASLVSIDPENGQILAMAGSRDYFNDEIDGKVNVALRPRLPGSSFKPIVYAAAFLQGYAPATVLYDVKTKFGSWYEPENFDGTFLGPMSMRQALAWSRNVPAVKSGYLAGISNVIDLARKMGIQLNQPDDWYGLSLALGAGEARLIDMVTAYSVFANGGYKLDIISILKVEDRNGNILEKYELPEKREQILDPQAAYLVNHILTDKDARPAGYWRDRLSIPGQVNGAKTGTSNKQKENPNYNAADEESEEFINYPFDGWTLGYTKSIAAGVWCGNSDGTAMKLKASGLDTAGGIWHDFMVAATAEKLPKLNRIAEEEGEADEMNKAGTETEEAEEEPINPYHESREFEQPEGIRFINVAKRSGKLPSEHTPEDEIITEIFAGFSVPTEADDSYQLVEIDKASGKLATEFTPAPAREMKAFFRHHSILPDNPNWEEAVRKWAEENGEDEEPPTEYDDVHTANMEDSKPEVRMVAPITNSTVGYPYVNVVLNINSANGVAQVDYYWDDELVETVKESPYRGQLKISRVKDREGSAHTIKAVVFDRLYHSVQASAEVKVGTDTLPPQVHFTYPMAEAVLVAGNFMTAEVNAYDPNGDVERVEFFMDDEPRFIAQKPPYVWSFAVPEAPGEHRLKAVAYDYSENHDSAGLLFEVTAAPPEPLDGDTRLLSPVKNQSFSQGESIVLKVYVDKIASHNLKELIVLAKQENGRPQEIVKIFGSPDTAGTFLYTLLWSTPGAGRYELSLKAVLKDGKIRFSEKVPIVVR